MTYLENNDKEIGQRIKKERTLKGLTIAELSERTGLSIVTLSRIECGKNHARLCNLNKIAQALNIELKKIIK